MKQVARLLGMLGVVGMIGVAFVACGDDDDDGGSTSGGTGPGAGGAAGSGSGGSGSGAGGSGGSGQQQQCTTASGCINNACGCTEGPNKDKPCCNLSVDPNCTGSPACDELCKVCQ